MTTYYNEIEPYAAEWIRNLIRGGHIAPGIVDERSIEDVHPSDLKGFTQCHFFAGIGVWSYALRRAGWADDRPVWTGSCPCQPFSAAGKGVGFADERHLWPDFFHLISECRPAAVFGEQVASKDAGPWIDLVHADLESMGYAFGAIPFPSASIGAPHIRDRLYWVANVNAKGVDRMVNTKSIHRGHMPAPRGLGGPQCSEHRQARQGDGQANRAAGAVGELGNTERAGLALSQRIAGIPGVASGADQRKAAQRAGIHADARPGPTNGFWRDADWIFCRDGKWRPVEPGTQPLAHGAPARVGRLRAYGNAINAEAARVFIESTMRAAA